MTQPTKPPKRPSNVNYHCWTHTTDELARVLFFNHYGHEAPELYREGDAVYLGPKPEQQTAPIHQPAPAIQEVNTSEQPQPPTDEQLRLF